MKITAKSPRSHLIQTSAYLFRFGASLGDLPRPAFSSPPTPPCGLPSGHYYFRNPRLLYMLPRPKPISTNTHVLYQDYRRPQITHNIHHPFPINRDKVQCKAHTHFPSCHPTFPILQSRAVCIPLVCIPLCSARRIQSQVQMGACGSVAGSFSPLSQWYLYYCIT